MSLRQEEITISESSLDFGSQGKDFESSTQVVVVTNVGYDTVHIYDVSVVGDFLLKSSVPGSLLAGENMAIQVAFKPTVLGACEGGLYLDTGNAAGPEFVSLSGVGIVYEPDTYTIDGGFYLGV